jgi:hypothetical protein
MKRFFRKAALVVAVASIGSMVNAQTPSNTPSVQYGSTAVQLDSNFVNSLQGLGAVFTDTHGNPLQNNVFTVQAVAGVLDLTNSAGEVEHTGGLVVNVLGAIIRFQNLTIDVSNPYNPVMTAEYILNDHFVARLALFNIAPPAGFSLPFTLQSGSLRVNGLILTLAPASATALDNLFGGPYLQAGASMGTANSFVTFSALN